MTREQFRELLKSVNPNLARYWAPTLDLPRATSDTAVYCFINEINDYRTDEIRKQLMRLNTIGFFDFEDEKIKE